MAGLEVSARLRALLSNGKPFTELPQAALGSECASVGARPAVVRSRGPAGALSGMELQREKEGFTDNLIESQLNGKESI